METISWKDFEKVELRVGTIVAVHDFPEAKKPAYKLEVDYGEFGIKKSSAQLTKLYKKEELIGRQVLGVINFPPKQVANMMSEALVTGVICDEGEVVLVSPDRKVKNGLKLL